MSVWLLVLFLGGSWLDVMPLTFDDEQECVELGQQITRNSRRLTFRCVKSGSVL